MKAKNIQKKITMLAAAAAFMGALTFTACKNEQTQTGANEVITTTDSSATGTTTLGDAETNSGVSNATPDDAGIHDGGAAGNNNNNAGQPGAANKDRGNDTVKSPKR